MKKKKWLLVYDPNQKVIHFADKMKDSCKYVSNHVMEYFVTQTEMKNRIIELSFKT